MSSNSSWKLVSQTPSTVFMSSSNWNLIQMISIQSRCAWRNTVFDPAQRLFSTLFLNAYLCIYKTFVSCTSSTVFISSNVTCYIWSYMESRCIRHSTQTVVRPSTGALELCPFFEILIYPYILTSKNLK